MSMLFDDTTPDFYTSTNLYISSNGYPCSIFAIYNTDDANTFPQAIYSINANLNYIALVRSKDAGVGTSAIVKESFRTVQADSGNGAGGWEAACAVFTSDTRRDIYHWTDFYGYQTGSNTTSRTTNLSGGSNDVARISSNLNYFSGQIQEVAVWDIALSAATARGMVIGKFAPPLVRRSNLVVYIPMIRDNRRNYIDRTQFSVSGSPSISTHGLVNYPVNRNIFRRNRPRALDSLGQFHKRKLSTEVF